MIGLEVDGALSELISIDSYFSTQQKCLQPLFKSSAESMGDLYLDVAEAYLEKGKALNSLYEVFHLSVIVLKM